MMYVCIYIYIHDTYTYVQDIRALTQEWVPFPASPARADSSCSCSVTSLSIRGCLGRSVQERGGSGRHMSDNQNPGR